MIRKLLAEGLGTFALVFAGTGAIVANSISHGAVSHVGIALTFGIVIMVFIYALAGVSGAHFNPAVTLGFLQLRKIGVRQFFLYSISQLIGAILASFCLANLIPDHGTLGATIPQVSPLSAFTIEVISTFFLMFVILQVTELGTKLPSTAGLAIGSTVALDALFAGQFTGASMNPARSIAPAIISGNFSYLWIYILAPVLGAAVAAGISSYLRIPEN